MSAVMTSRASLLQSHQPTTLLLSRSLPAVGHRKPGDISTYYTTLRSPRCLINIVIITITRNVVDVERVWKLHASLVLQLLPLTSWHIPEQDCLSLSYFSYYTVIFRFKSSFLIFFYAPKHQNNTPNSIEV